MPPVTLVQLPREIRDRIYDFVFPWEEIRPVFVGGNRRYTFSDPIQIPPLLLINHQISSEAAVSLYSNRVWVGQPLELLSFLEKVGSCGDLIKNVHVKYCSFISVEAWLPKLFGLLSCLSGLRSVTLMMLEYNLTAAQRKLAGMGFDLLKGQVEVVINNDRVHAVRLGDDTYKSTLRKSIWKRAAGAMDWVEEGETVIDFPGVYRTD